MADVLTASCRYRSTSNVNLPFKVHPIVEEVGKSRVEYTVNLKANFDPKLTGTNVVMRIPTPPNTTSVKCEVGFGKAKWVSADNAIVWKIPRIQGMSDASLQAEATLSQVTVRKAWSRPPIEMDFQVLMLTASGECSATERGRKLVTDDLLVACFQDCWCDTSKCGKSLAVSVSECVRFKCKQWQWQ